MSPANINTIRGRRRRYSIREKYWDIMFLEDDSFISDWEDTEDVKTKISYAFAAGSSTSTACCSVSCNALAQSASVFFVLFLFGITRGD